MAKGDEGNDGLGNVNSNLSKLKRDLRATASFLDRQMTNENENLKFTHSDFMKGICEGKVHGYELAIKLIMHDLEKYEGVE